jgi:flagellar biogenesis protein FliO
MLLLIIFVLMLVYVLYSLYIIGDQARRIEGLEELVTIILEEKTRIMLIGEKEDKEE